ncbi:hypothetical protein O3P69_009766 [Scylla paramamosain]|uniref:Histone acetyltransferase n=1 Tax=Scylla paramamosain TaxID=85552 RepID=A0AAW0SQC1_SCYPA
MVSQFQGWETVEVYIALHLPAQSHKSPHQHSIDVFQDPNANVLPSHISWQRLWKRAMVSLCAMSNPTIDDDALDAETGFSVRSIVTLGAVESLATTATDSDLAMEELRRAAHEDPAYVELLQHIKQGFPSDRYALPNTLRPYWKLLRVQDPTTKRWDKVGTVMGIGKSRDYLVKMPSGRIWWRNRRFLRPSMSPSKDLPPTDATPPGAESPQPALPRRSARIKGRRDAQDTACYEREGGREM